MSETYEAGDNCPHCGSPATCHDSDEWDWECGTVGYRLRMAQSDRCRTRQFNNAASLAIEALRNARERTDKYEDDLEYERAIDALLAAMHHEEGLQ